MKPLHEMNNVERGRLLADLFPLELPKITLYIQQKAQQVREDEQNIKAHWASTLFSPHLWFSLVENVDKKITKFGTKLHKNRRWFADQLFDGYDALFTLYCLHQYTYDMECDYLLRQAIHLIFGEERLILTKPENDNKN